MARDERGEPTGYIAIESDVTARRLASQRDSLARRVAALLFASDSVEQMGAALVRELVGELDLHTAQLWRAAPGGPPPPFVSRASPPLVGRRRGRLRSPARRLGGRASHNYLLSPHKKVSKAGGLLLR